jgi:hypothetical protein
MEKSEMHTNFRWENLKNGIHYEKLDVNGMIILKWFSKK